MSPSKPVLTGIASKSYAYSISKKTLLSNKKIDFFLKIYLSVNYCY